MSDPRNVAHDKKVNQQKQHEEEKAVVAEQREGGATAVAEAPEVEQAPGELEKSVAVLSKLKEMEHYSRANIETLAGVMLTIDDELKHKEFSEAISNVYAAQSGFQTAISGLIEEYDAKCASLRPAV